MIEPRLVALEEAEARREKADAAERAAFADPESWHHPGARCHQMLVTCDDVAANVDHQFAYAEAPSWSCCLASAADARGCRRIDEPGLELLRMHEK